MGTSSNKFSKITIAIITLALTVVIKHFCIEDINHYESSSLFTELDMNQLLGAEIDYSAPGPARDLFLNYCLYKHNGCADEFKKVYLADIITCQNQLLVERKMQDADNEEEGA